MKKLFFLIALFSLFSISAMAQCGMKVSFTYTEGTNGEVTFASNVTGGVAPYTFEWNLGNNNLITEANPVLTYPANNSYGVCVDVRDANGCTDSTCQQITVTTAPTIACPGQATFTVSTNGVLTDFTFSPSIHERTIDFGDGQFEQVTTNVVVEHAYKTNGTYTATANYNFDTVINGFYIPINCGAFSQDITVSNVQCHADFIVSTDTISFLAGRFSLFNMSTDYSSLRWYVDGNRITALNDTFFYTDTYAPGVHNICLSIAGPNGCSDSICKTAVLNYTPVCSGLSFNYSALSSPCNAYQFTTTNTGSPLVSIEWMDNNSTASTQENPVITLDFTSSQNNITNHVITVKAMGTGCSSAQTFSFDNPAGFNIYEQDSLSATHIWAVYPNVALNIASQTWDFGDGTTSNEAYPTHTYASAGVYNLCHQIILTNGCSYNLCHSQNFFRTEQGNTVVKIIVEAPTAVKNVSEPLKVHFYPNPVTGNFYIEVDKPLIYSTLIIYNTVGQLVKIVPVNAGGKLFSSNIMTLSAGVYYYQIVEKEASIYRGKFIVTK